MAARIVVLDSNVRPIQRRMKISAELAAARSARNIAKRAKELAPKDTGALAESIEAKGNGATWTVEVGVDYGGFVEFGTRYMDAQPYLGPAAEERFHEFPLIFREIFNQGSWTSLG